MMNVYSRKWHTAVVRMWLARNQLLAHKREVEEYLAAEAKLAMEAEAKEEARIEEEKRREELRIKEQDALADGVTECIKEVAIPAPADSVGTEVNSLMHNSLVQFSSSASEACHVKLSNPGP